MMISHAVPFTYKGQDAQMRVLRNNGYCWGRMVLADGTEVDVSTNTDHYDDTDTEAAEAFIRAARFARCRSAPATTWRAGFAEGA